METQNTSVATVSMTPDELKKQEQIALKILISLYVALENATGDGNTALGIISSITEGINADPAFSRKILTPENIAEAYKLKAKSDAGKIKLSDIEKSFPGIVKLIPFWSMITTFIPRQYH
jgi:hypothetical protein